ncbi:Methyltransf_11 domain-containing protein [Cephalotus follicularis]|uniref:Methyltransf_11 domain-containing protein n=1 Tax=Cephalotus follicularis TaxID=3775 RepID=A0A1Q3BK19_CEPFO|nr:Methyltransf_11 domain-containing protein [Cephalotus follicularis]
MLSYPKSKHTSKQKHIYSMFYRMSKMANPFGVTVQQRVPVLAGTCPCSSLFTKVTKTITVVKKLNVGDRTARRIVLGLGASFWAQFMSMAGSAVGAKSFIASARQKGAVEEILKNVEWPEQFPFKSEDFQRFDESPDSLFYEAPRFVTHIDDPAIAALSKYYSKVFPPSNTPGVSILDLCSSWVSHFPAGYKQERVVGVGMNEEELKRNPVLTEYVVQDLNQNPKLPFEDNLFDVITNVVSVDYITKPVDVFKEMCRVLKPGGLAIMSFSNRCFWTKAISIWTSTGDAEHVMIVGSYFHYAGGFEPPQAEDISPNPGRSDPMYVVYSTKAFTT